MSQCHADIRTFAQHFWLADDDIEFRMILRDGDGDPSKPKLQHLHVKANEVANDDLVQTLAQLNASGYNVCASISPRKGKTRGDENVLLARCLFADFDKVADADAVRARITAARLPDPTMLVMSGHGHHVYWRLTEPMTNLDHWQLTMKRLASVLQSDPAVSNLERVMRVPGTVNHKPPPAPCRLIYCHDMCVALTDILAALPVGQESLPDPNPTPPACQAPSNTGVPTDDEASVYGTAALKRECSIVQNAQDGERNSKLNKAAFSLGQLVASGHLDEQTVRTSLLKAATGCGLPQAEAKATTESGLKGGKNNPRSEQKSGVGPPPLASTAGPETAARCMPVITRLADVKPEPVHWLWPGRIPLGCLTLLVGRPGCGKSFLTCDIAARVSTGSPWPDGSGAAPVGDVLLVTAEDGLGNTIRPRLDAHKADVKRVLHMGEVREIDPKTNQTRTRMFTLADLPMLEEALRTLNAPRLVVIDPIGSFLGGEVDAHRDNEVRSVLAPLDQMAKHFGCAVVAVMHTRKGVSGRADDSALGSRAFTGLARAVHHLRIDPENDDRRLFLPGKMNLCSSPDGRAFTIDGNPAKLVWEPDPVDVTADEIDAEGNKRGPSAEARQAAMEWLREQIKAGPMAAKDVIEAAKAAGHTRRTLYRAGKALGVVHHRSRYQGTVTWSLPSVPAAPQSLAQGQPGNNGTDGNNGGHTCQDHHICQVSNVGDSVAPMAGWPAGGAEVANGHDRQAHPPRSGSPGNLAGPGPSKNGTSAPGKAVKVSGPASGALVAPVVEGVLAHAGTSGPPPENPVRACPKAVPPSGDGQRPRRPVLRIVRKGWRVAN